MQQEFVVKDEKYSKFVLVNAPTGKNYGSKSFVIGFRISGEQKTRTLVLAVNFAFRQETKDNRAAKMARKFAGLPELHTAMLRGMGCTADGTGL